MQIPVFSMISQTLSNWVLSSLAMGRERLRTTPVPFFSVQREITPLKMDHLLLSPLFEI
jgi:hypothetical protein